MKNAFDGLVNRLGIICGIEEMLIETSTIKIQGGNKSMKRQKNCGTIIKGVVYTKWEHHKDKKQK